MKHNNKCLQGGKMSNTNSNTVPEKFKKLEERYEESKKKLNTIINNMEQLDPTESEIKNQYNFYGTCTVWKYEDVEKYFSMKCKTNKVNGYLKLLLLY